MEVVEAIHCLAPPHGSAVTIGSYDGVHLGHRLLLDRLVLEAHSRGISPTVVTFDRHPASVVRPDSAPPLLVDKDQKLELLAQAGIERTLIVSFDERQSKESPEDFLQRILIGALDARLVMVGENFRFGFERRGDLDLLTKFGNDHGFEVIPVELASKGEYPVSSTRIRRLIVDGEIAEANSLLGYDFQVRGEVVHGDGRGRVELGFPTANILVSPQIVPVKDGIYAAVYERPDSSRYIAAVSVGHRPMFDHDPSNHSSYVIEAFLLDFEGDLYREKAKLSFVARLRDQLVFDSLEDLIAQMNLDVIEAKSLLMRN